MNNIYQKNKSADYAKEIQRRTASLGAIILGSVGSGVSVTSIIVGCYYSPALITFGILGTGISLFTTASGCIFGLTPNENAPKPVSKEKLEKIKTLLLNREYFDYSYLIDKGILSKEMTDAYESLVEEDKRLLAPHIQHEQVMESKKSDFLRRWDTFVLNLESEYPTGGLNANDVIHEV
jgi:hypothetical protein